MLLTLSLDALDYICDYFDLQELLNLADTSSELLGYVKTRLNIHWRNPKTVLPQRLIRLYECSTGEIQCSADVLYEARNCFDRLNFQSITALTLTTSNLRISKTSNVEQLITRIFPRVRKLRLRGNFQCGSIWRLGKLKNLEIDSPEINENSIRELEKVKNLRKLCLKQPLKGWPKLKQFKKMDQLRELHICASDGEMLSKHLGYRFLKGLRKLVLARHTTENLYVSLKDSAYYRKVYSIRFNIRLRGQQPDDAVFCFGKMDKLRRLYFINDDGSTLRKFCEHYIQKADTLEQIHYINDTEEISENLEEQQNNLIALVKCSKNLKCLNINGLQIDGNFLQKLDEEFSSSPHNNDLQVYCSSSQIPNDFSIEELKTYNLHHVRPRLYFLNFLNPWFGHEPPPQNSIEINFHQSHGIEELFEHIEKLLEKNRRLLDFARISNYLEGEKRFFRRFQTRNMVKDIFEYLHLLEYFEARLNYDQYIEELTSGLYKVLYSIIQQLIQKGQRNFENIF